jgi:deoxyribose-phosphate aldolase
MQKEWTKATLAKTIDHTLLKAIATADRCASSARRPASSASRASA